MTTTTTLLPRLTLARAARLLRAGLVSSEELCLYCHNLAIVGEERWNLNAFTHITDLDDLLDEARASDNRRTPSSVALSPLDGIPVSVKANLAVSALPLTASSRILGENGAPCGYDADVVQKILRQCGAVLVGVTNMDEFGMGSLGTNGRASPTTGSNVTRNPTPYLRRLEAMDTSTPVSHEKDVDVANFIRDSIEGEMIVQAHMDAFEKASEEPVWSAGGSSCGSAASVAHGSSLISLGSDTGGSVRLPAAWCGVVGLKPSYGLLSRHGLVSYASSLDCVGVLAPSVGCAKLVLDALSDRAEISRDSTASNPVIDPAPVSPAIRNLVDPSGGSRVDSTQHRLSGLKVGVPEGFSVTDCSKSIHSAWTRGAEYLQQQGAIIQTVPASVISPAIVQHSLAAYYVLASAEACSNLKRYDGVRYGTDRIVKDDSPQDEDALTPLERQYSATRTECFGREVARRILCGTSVLSSDRFHSHYEAAARLRALLTQQLQSALTEMDLLLIPTTLALPYQLGGEPQDSTEMFGLDVMTVPISLAGLPSVSVPMVSTNGDAHGVPGLQLVGPRLSEQALLGVARIMEEANTT